MVTLLRYHGLYYVNTNLGSNSHDPINLQNIKESLLILLSLFSSLLSPATTGTRQTVLGFRSSHVPHGSFTSQGTYGQCPTPPSPLTFSCSAKPLEHTSVFIDLDSILSFSSKKLFVFFQYLSQISGFRFS